MSLSESINFHCFFDVNGRQNSYTHKAMFKLTYEDTYNLTLHFGDNVIQKATAIDMQRYAVKPLVGKLQDKNNNKSFNNAKLVFIQKDINNSTFTNLIRDVCYTNNDGSYIAYVENGTYDIEIYINNEVIVKRNVVINQGLSHTYSLFVNGLIHIKNKDIISYCNCEYKNINGVLTNLRNEPVNNAEILVINNNNIVAYVKTDNQGKYRFALKNGTYTVKIRSEQSPMKQNEVIIDDIHTFQEQLIKNNIQFTHGATLLM